MINVNVIKVETTPEELHKAAQLLHNFADTAKELMELMKPDDVDEELYRQCCEDTHRAILVGAAASGVMAGILQKHEEEHDEQHD